MTGLRICALVAATALAVGGCSFGKGGDGGESGGQPTQKKRFQVGDGGGKGTPVEFPAKPAATVKSSVQGLEIELYDVHKAGRSATVVFALHNTGSEPIGLESVGEQLDAENAGEAEDLYARDVSLIDGQNLKEYQTFISDNGACLCTLVNEFGSANEIAAGKSLYQMAQVGAPPASVERVTVSLGRLASIPNVQPSQ